MNYSITSDTVNEIQFTQFINDNLVGYGLLEENELNGFEILRCAHTLALDKIQSKGIIIDLIYIFHSFV